METGAIINGYNHPHGSLIPEPLDPRYHIGVHNQAGGFQDANVAWNPVMYNKDNVYEDIEQNQSSAEKNDHREMAIDVPAGFIGTKKERPHYPSNSVSRGQNSSHNTPLKGTFHAGSSETDLEIPPKMTVEEEMEHREKIKRYQEDLRRRREEENRIAKEQEFLRTSLRGSKKLQSLEELNREGKVSGHASGIINPNFVNEEDLINDKKERPGVSSASRAGTLPIRYPDYAARSPQSKY